MLDTLQVIYNTCNHQLFKYCLPRKFVESRRLLTCTREVPIRIQAGAPTSPSGSCCGFLLSIQIQDQYLKLSHSRFSSVTYWHHVVWATDNFTKNTYINKRDCSTKSAIQLKFWIFTTHKGQNMRYHASTSEHEEELPYKSKQTFLWHVSAPSTSSCQ